MPDLKIFATHPVQYLVPFYRELIEAGLEIEVGYYHQGTAGRVGRDAEFGIDIEWDIDLLTGYRYHIFLSQMATYTVSEQIKLAPKFLRWASRGRQTPLLLIGWSLEIVWLVWLLRNSCRAPVMLLSETTPLSFAASPKPRWRRALLSWLLRNTSACLFIGTRNRDFYSTMQVPDERLFFVPYSIDNARFSREALKCMPRRQELCQQYGLDPGLPAFLSCGKLIPKKRPLQLFEAYMAAGLKDRAQLLYVGEGMLRPEIECRIQNAGARHVHLIGFFNQTQMPLAYVLGEILCLISDPTETWGLVVNEALACGRPVIVSETVGCAPDLVGEENGWVVPLDDLDMLVKTLLNAYERREEWPRIGQRGREKVAEHKFSAMAAGVRSALACISKGNSS
jgi:glycosyltransferase involved in cell wall biosynthesis